MTVAAATEREAPSRMAEGTVASAVTIAANTADGNIHHAN